MQAQELFLSINATQLNVSHHKAGPNAQAINIASHIPLRLSDKLMITPRPKSQYMLASTLSQTVTITQ